MNLICSCGSKKLKKLKFGGNIFSLQQLDKMNIFRGSGFQPDIWVCSSCNQVLFSIKDEDMDKI